MTEQSRPGQNPESAVALELSQCDLMLIGAGVRAHASAIEVKNTTESVEHEATTSKIGEDHCKPARPLHAGRRQMIVNG